MTPFSPLGGILRVGTSGSLTGEGGRAEGTPPTPGPLCPGMEGTTNRRILSPRQPLGFRRQAPDGTAGVNVQLCDRQLREPGRGGIARPGLRSLIYHGAREHQRQVSAR